MFLSCELCGETVFEEHYEFHLSKHVGMGTTIRLLQQRSDSDQEQEDDKVMKNYSTSSIVRRIGFKRSIL
jgi:hypothetical protein